MFFITKAVHLFLTISHHGDLCIQLNRLKIKREAIYKACQIGAKTLGHLKRYVKLNIVDLKKTHKKFQSNGRHIHLMSYLVVIFN
jgi:hypothetical protein